MDRPIKIYKGYVREDGINTPAPSTPNPDDPQGPQVPAGVPNHNALEGLQGGDPDAVEFFHLTEAQFAAIAADTSTRRISGGVIQWTGTGYEFNISPVVYKVQGTDLSIINSSSRTLDPSDPTLNRTDAFYVDADQTVKIRKGTSGPTFTPPEIDPTTEVLLGFIQVPAASTTPAGLTDLLVYDEGTETTFSTAGTGTAVDDDTADPYTGTNAVKVTNASPGFKIRFTFASDQDLTNATSLGLFLQLFTAIRNRDNISAKWLDASLNQVGIEVSLNFNKGGQDPSVVGSYQFASVDFSLFAVGSTPVRTLEFEMKSRRIYQGFRMDLVKVEDGLTQPAPAPIQPDPPVAKEYPDQATMLANQNEQKAGYLYFDGTSTFWFKGTRNGLISDYQPFVDLSNYYTKAETDPLQSTGSEIAFDRPRTYGSDSAPITATTLTESNTGLRNVTQVIFHQAASLTVPASWKKSTGSDDYDPAKVNVIYVEAFSSTYKRYIIDSDE